MHARVMAGLLLVAAFAAVAQTSVYRWTDKDGKVQFSDTPPPPEVQGVTQKSMGGSPADESQVPYGTQVAMKRNPVSLYVTEDCGTPCERARGLLSARGIPYSERNPRASQAAMDALRELAGGLEVPMLIVGSAKLKGFDEDAWNAALDSAGYARTRVPGVPIPKPANAAPPGPAPAQ